MILGITGYAGAGKDEAWRGIQYRGTDGYVRRAFADELKSDLDDFCKKHYGISARTSDPKEKALIRDILVFHGKTMRILNHDHWVGKVASTLVPGESVNYAITDVRYANECRWIQSLGGKVVLINRNLWAANEEEHRSIAEIVDAKLVDHIIDNLGTIEELHAKMSLLVA